MHYLRLEHSRFKKHLNVIQHVKENDTTKFRKHKHFYKNKTPTETLKEMTTWRKMQNTSDRKITLLFKHSQNSKWGDVINGKNI